MKRTKIPFILTVALFLLTATVFTSCSSDSDGKDDVTYFTVTYDSAGGSEITERKVVKDGLAPCPDDPEKAGYVFECWTLDGKEWDFNYNKVSSDVTLTAKWIDAAHIYGYEAIDGNAYVTEVKKEYTTLKLPTQIGGLPVVGISDGTFEGTDSENISTIILSETVTYVGSNAFKGCKDVDVRVTGELTHIGDGAFFGCNALSSVSLGEGLTCIPPEAFSGCSALTEVSLPDSLTVIDENAFDGCSSLVSLILGANVQTVADSAFSDCEALKAVYYRGSREAFESIGLEPHNEALTDAVLYVYSETQPEQSGNYWYINTKGKIKIWK